MSVQEVAFGPPRGALATGLKHSPEQDEISSPWRFWIPSVSGPSLYEEDLNILLWQVRGKTDLRVDEVEHHLTPGHAMWIPVRTRHEFTVHANSVMMPLMFDVAEVATTLEEPTVVIVEPSLHPLMLAYSVSRHSIIKPTTNLARQILSQIEKQPTASASLPTPTSKPAQIIAETLRFNPGDVRNIEELADSVHTSSRTIERAFSAETGMTLRQWRLRNRMEAAAVFLRSNTTVDAVAHRVGYTNVDAFRRVFKSRFGVSPTEYTRHCREL